MSFDALCREPRAAADYLALAGRFHTLVVDRIPVLGADERNPAKRLITLVDTLYDNGVKLFASAAGEPATLYTASEGKEAFEFRRTVSRLTEMRSSAWLAVPHRHRGETAVVPVET
jgi:cell division protein ZapE